MSAAPAPPEAVVFDPPPEAVVFDLGNVLIAHDPLPAIAAVVGEVEARRFLTATDFDFFAWNDRQDAGRRWDDAEAEVLRTHPHWHRHAAAYRANFDLALLGEIEESVAVLRDLHAAGVPLVALSNWSAETFGGAQDRFGFLSLFDDLVISGEVGLVKPDPRIFALLAERLGRPLGRCLFVDDVPRNVEAARAAGLPAILFTRDLDLRSELRRSGLPF